MVGPPRGKKSTEPHTKNTIFIKWNEPKNMKTCLCVFPKERDSMYVSYQLVQYYSIFTNWDSYVSICICSTRWFYWWVHFAWPLLIFLGEEKLEWEEGLHNSCICLSAKGAKWTRMRGRASQFMYLSFYKGRKEPEWEKGLHNSCIFLSTRSEMN